MKIQLRQICLVARELAHVIDIEQQQFPGFVNLQQYYVEEYLYDAVLAALDELGDGVDWNTLIWSREPLPEVDSRLTSPYSSSAKWPVSSM